MGQMSDFPFGIEDVAALLQLRVRRPNADGAYVDCPFCGEGRGRMYLRYSENVWRCNYCGEHGGMLHLYGKLRNVSTSTAYREICEAILNGFDLPRPTAKQAEQPVVTRTPLADVAVIHKTLTALLGMLKLSEEHREHLRTVRGLTDEQIAARGYKSTPPFYMCQPLTARLIAQGYTVRGVPGFYQRNGQWTVNFNSLTSGILIPARGLDGRVHGCQIRLDVPLKADGEKTGAKYLWFSSGSKPMGTSSGSPVHFVGDPFARVVYVTEGLLKADVAHYLMNRTFVAIAGANNTAPLDMLFALLAANGTQTIVEAADMDKYRNPQVHKGVSQIWLLAKKHGLQFRRLNWNPNYKGVDDWQLALRRKAIAELPVCVDGEGAREQRFRIYQLHFSTDRPVIPFAFSDMAVMRQERYDQPPADAYTLVYTSSLPYADGEGKEERLRRIAARFSDTLPEDFAGHSLAPSDVVELYDEAAREYYYYDRQGFHPVKFSPMLAKRRI